MQVVVGYIMIFLGIAFLILSLLVWLGVLKPAEEMLLAKVSGWDVLLALVKKLPWTATVGLLLIYAGMKMIGINLPF
jgi:hypothetical protein